MTTIQLSEQAEKFALKFIDQESLPSSYLQTVEQFYGPLAQTVRQVIRRQNGVPIIGINGAQGCGKSTVSACLAGLLEQQGISALILSIDDLYLTRAERQQLAATVHPLFATRGVPGTHDVALGQRVFDTARGIAKQPLSKIPQFDKAQDDRSSTGAPFPEKIDVILFEGWCIGARAQDETSLSTPLNALEENHDPDGVWRRYVNNALLNEYAELFGQIDYLVMLKPPSFEMVYHWRGEQEAKLRKRTEAAGGDLSSIMNEEQLAFFIAHYERLTRWMFEEMPERADEIFLINEEHNVFERSSLVKPRLCISTDLDATLLDDSYSWQPARPALTALAERGDCVVLNSSKTVAEMIQLAGTLQAECNLPPAPLIAENGAVIALPDPDKAGQYRIECLDLSRSEILDVAHNLRSEHGCDFTGFADMTAQTVSELTALPLEDALLAMDRQATEPILWNGSDQEWVDFVEALGQQGIRAVRGGRFIHLMGQSDKANGLRTALSECRKAAPESLWAAVALGDSPNDSQMLNAADIAVVIPNPGHAASLQPTALQCVHPEKTGPAAWNDAMLTILKELGVPHG